MITKQRPWLALGVPICLFGAYTAFCGIFRPKTYEHDTPIYAAQGIGQDYANLFAVLPAFIVTWTLSWRGSLGALLVHVGVLAYLVYSYSMYAITVRFNELFLFYTSCFGLSLYSMVGILLNVDTEGLCIRITQGSVHKRFGISLACLFILTAGMFYKMWLGEIIPHIMAGTVPQSIVESGLPSNMVYVLDLGIVLPFVLLTAIWLLLGSIFGYLFTPVLLSFTVCMMVALGSMVCVMYVRGQTESLAPVTLFGVLFLVNLAFEVMYLRWILGNKPERRTVKRE